ncbi:GntR family transcriptional regulator [Listeria costaricensis]|uniref:GntR family transcriptional regulator n=1 Tax=Listeria costaricensis TaxID=2026604 RepID=UPI000C07627E|nr:GntR family transcriptional regulator [Listeria costaricensis]
MAKKRSPIYVQLANDLKTKIQEKKYAVGEALPTEAALSEKYGVSRITIRKAISKLADEGYVDTIQGSGTYVKEKIEHNLFSLKSFVEEMAGKNRIFSSQILRFELQTAVKEIKEKLALPSDTETVYYIRRTRIVDDKIFAIEDTYMPLELFPDLTYEVMKGSKYRYIEQEKQMAIKDSKQEFIPILPPKDIAQLFEIGENIPILKIESIGYLDSGRPFEFSEVYYKSSEYRFTMTANRLAD